MAVKKKPGILRIQLVKSIVGRPEKTRAIVRSLGLKKMHSVVEQPKTPEIMGMIRKIDYLLDVEEKSL